MSSLRRTTTLAASTMGLAIIMFGIAAAIGQQPGGTGRSVAPRSAGATAPPVRGSETVGVLVDDLQAHLASQPKDSRSWAELGVAYVEQARLTSDATYYPKAERALERSMTIEPKNNADGLVGLSLLAAGRHDFATAGKYAREAIAVNPESAAAHGALSDALTELGHYDAGLAEARRMDDLRPGLPSLVRLAYHNELRGDVESARRRLTNALAQTTTPGDAAYVHGLLGDLAWSSGRVSDAGRHYAAALAMQPGYVPAMFGSARVSSARANLDTAIKLSTAVATRQPTIEHLRWNGELLDAVGRHAAARDQYDLARAAINLQRAQGVAVDLDVALFDADHGDHDAALAAARAALSARPGVFAEDAYAWTLHATGRDKEALEHANRAARLGTHSAQFAYHKGMIELSLGRRAAARTDLDRALRPVPALSPLDASRAVAARHSIGGA